MADVRLARELHILTMDAESQTKNAAFRQLRAIMMRLAKGEVWGLLGPPQRGWLGVTEDSTTDEARIARVVEGSPADLAGLRSGDVILRVGENEVKSFNDLQNEIGRLLPEDEIVIQIRRDGEIEQISVKLGSRPRRRA